MNKNIQTLINGQITKEFHSAYLYLGISEYFAKQNLNGFAAWYMAQAKEEQEHALKFYSYLTANGYDVVLGTIDAVTSSYASALEAVKAADKHEHYITDEITKIYAAAEKDKDYRTKLFLDWFIKEQEEEEQNSGDMVAKVELLGKDPKNLYLLDKEVGERK
ncbi:MAG: ferritin [Clostridiales bacterium]|nr:ferritin [Clostridiales bacterium]